MAGRTGLRAIPSMSAPDPISGCVGGGRRRRRRRRRRVRRGATQRRLGPAAPRRPGPWCPRRLAGGSGEPARRRCRRRRRRPSSWSRWRRSRRRPLLSSSTTRFDARPSAASGQPAAPISMPSSLELAEVSSCEEPAASRERRRLGATVEASSKNTKLVRWWRSATNPFGLE